MSEDVHYATIRDVIGDFRGARLVEITQHDLSEWEEEGRSCIWLHFDDGRSLRFIIGDDGFGIDE